MFFIIFGLIMCLGSYVENSSPSNWGYKTGMSFSSPDHWKDLPNTSCGGKKQSPVNIMKTNLVYRNNLKPVTVSSRKSNAIVSLEAHATSLYLSFSDTWTIGFGKEGCYRPIAIHWHWGLKDNKGSEHTIDGFQYDMEGHIVTYNCMLYNNSDVAMRSANGLHVFGLLYKIGEMNSALGKIIPLMDIVVNTRNATLSDISPVHFFPQNHASYYRYDGSLTTPPCTENVIWTVFHDIQTLSVYQLYKFRSLQFGAPESGPMGNNFRPVQPLTFPNENIYRIVYTSFNVGHICSYSFYTITLLIIYTLVL